MKEHFELKDITEALGIKRTKLQQWMAFGYVQPSIEQASGQGTRNIWSLADVVALAAFGELIKMGLSRSSAALLVNPKVAYEVDAKGVVKSESKYLYYVFDANDPLKIYDPYLVQFKHGDETIEIVVAAESGEMSALQAIQLVADKLNIKWDGILILSMDELSKKTMKALR